MFPAPILESVISPRSPSSFYWQMALEPKFKVLGMLIVTGVPLLLGPLNDKSKEIHVCILNPCIYTYLYFHR